MKNIYETTDALITEADLGKIFGDIRSIVSKSTVDQAELSKVVAKAFSKNGDQTIEQVIPYIKSKVDIDDRDGVYFDEDGMHNINDDANFVGGLYEVETHEEAYTIVRERDQSFMDSDSLSSRVLSTHECETIKQVADEIESNAQGQLSDWEHDAGEFMVSYIQEFYGETEDSTEVIKLQCIARRIGGGGVDDREAKAIKDYLRL